MKPKVLHVSHIFKGSKSRITKGKTTYAIHIPGFSGLLKRRITPTRTLGNEIANYVKAKSKLKGIIHSDEDLEGYQLSKEFDSLRKHLKAKKGDTLIIAAGEKEQVEKAQETKEPEEKKPEEKEPEEKDFTNVEFEDLGEENV